jgi:hypothetical protein
MFFIYLLCFFFYRIGEQETGGRNTFCGWGAIGLVVGTGKEEMVGKGVGG